MSCDYHIFSLRAPPSQCLFLQFFKQDFLFLLQFSFPAGKCFYCLCRLNRNNDPVLPFLHVFPESKRHINSKCRRDQEQPSYHEGKERSCGEIISCSHHSCTNYDGSSLLSPYRNVPY